MAGGEQTVRGVGGVFNNCRGSVCAPPLEYILHGGRRDPDDPLYSYKKLLQGLLLTHVTVSTPRCDAAVQDCSLSTVTL